MKVVISGPSGLDKTPFTEELKDYLVKKKKPTTLYHIGKLLCEELDIDDKKILNCKPKVLELGRRIVFKDIFNKIKNTNTENMIINTHNVFRYENALFPAFNIKHFEMLKPNMFISLIDDVNCIYLRLKKEKKDVNYSLKDLMVWREEEMMATEILAGICNCPHFIIARSYGPEIIYKLMFENHLKKVYVSFPITHIRGKPEEDDVNKFRKWVSKNAIAFDPYCAITEKELNTYLNVAKDDKKDTIEMETLNEKIKLKTAEVEEIMKDIDGQIVFRDFKLIDQSDMVLAFYPVDELENPILSSGVERELEYGRDHGKDVYLICKAKHLSPFIRCKKVFKSFDEAKSLFN